MAQAAAAAFQAMFDDQAAFRAWYDGALPRVYGFVLARCGGDRSLAADLAQDTFVEAVRSRAHFSGASDPVTWVCGIARHKIADHFRREARERRRRFRVLQGGLDEGDAVTPIDELEEFDERIAIEVALTRLPRDQAVVLAMHYLDGLAVREIAQRLGRSEKSVESLLTRGRDSFRRFYRLAETGEQG